MKQGMLDKDSFGINYQNLASQMTGRVVLAVLLVTAALNVPATRPQSVAITSVTISSKSTGRHICLVKTSC